MTENRPQDYQLYQSASTLSPLNAKLIKISQSNDIAIMTASGVCLMRSDNDWNESIDRRLYRKFIIANPKHTFGQCLQRIIKRNVNRLSSDEMQKVYLDHTLYPLNNSAVYKGYRNFEWSHGLCPNDEPLFALLSMEHELWIYQQNQTDAYEPVVNVSKLLLDGYTRTHQQRHELNFESIKDLIYSTALIKMCWTEFVQNNFTQPEPASQTNESPTRPASDGGEPSVSPSIRKSRSSARSPATKKSLKTVREKTPLSRSPVTIRNFSCLLIALSRNGILYFFKIDQTESAVNCSYLNEWTPDDLVIRDVFYFSNSLILVFTNGQVELISFELNLQNLDEQNFDFSTLIRQKVTLWPEEDHIEVDDLLAYEQDSAIHVVFTKTDHIIVKVLEVVSHQSEKRRRRTCSATSSHLNSSKKSSTSQSPPKPTTSKLPNIPTALTNRPIVINYHHEQLQVKRSLVDEALFKISSSGLCRLHNGDLLISSTDGNYYRVQITGEPKLKQKKFSFPGLTSVSYCPMSLGCTADGYLCCTISYICSYFDHLELRDSTRITVFTTLTRSEVFEAITNLIELNPANNSFAFKSLYNLLECYKIYRLSANEKTNFDLSTYCVPESKLEELADLNLKVLRFALLCDQLYRQRNQGQRDPNIAKFTFDEEARKVEKAINGDNAPDKSSEQGRHWEVLQIDGEDLILAETVDLDKSDREAAGNAAASSSQSDSTLANVSSREFNQKSKQKDENSLHHAELIRKIEDILSGRHLSELVQTKLEQTAASKPSLSAEQRQSVGLIGNYLNNASPVGGEQSGGRKSKTTKKKSKESNVGERCPICEAPVETTDRYTASCSNGHQFDRCCYSLLICDLSRFNYRLCSLCKRLTFIRPMIWPSDENSSYCLYCS